jgi:hypothetical protein
MLLLEHRFLISFISEHLFKLVNVGVAPQVDQFDVEEPNLGSDLVFYLLLCPLHQLFNLLHMMVHIG